MGAPGRGIAGLAVVMAACAAQPPAAGAETPGATTSAPANMAFVSTGPFMALGMADYGIATVETEAAIDIVIANDAPAAFTPGTTTIAWTVTDATGRTGGDTQEVTAFPGCVSPRHPTYVEARGPRTTIVPGDSRALPEGIAVSLLDVTTSDRPFKVDDGRTMLWTMADGAGNTATCTERFVVRDRTPRRSRTSCQTSSSPPRFRWPSRRSRWCPRMSRTSPAAKLLCTTRRRGCLAWETTR